jgi:hypothetical protein
MLISEIYKDETLIYNNLKELKCIQTDIYNNKICTGIDDFRIHYKRHLETHNESWGEGTYYAAPSSWHGSLSTTGIEKNQYLKPITVVIDNWERQYYIPYIMAMYNNQDYPKKLLEVIVVDDDSKDKEGVLKIVMEQAKLYPDIKMRFIQNYVNKCKCPAKRVNIGIRHASHNICIMNETDTLPLGKSFLRGICYSHNVDKNIWCTGIPIGFPPMLKTLDDMFDPAHPAGVKRQLGAPHVVSYDRDLFCKIRGYDEQHVGWGGHEGNIASRMMRAGGRGVVNLEIYTGTLENFPYPPGTPHAAPGIDDWQRGEIVDKSGVVNDENWGISEKMEEVDLYKGLKE